MSNKNKNLKIGALIGGITFLSIVVLGAVLSIGLMNKFSGQNISPTTESAKNSELPESASWKEDIIVTIPKDPVGGMVDINLTTQIPCFKNAFSGNVTFEKSSLSNEFVISKEGSNLLDSNRYMEAFDIYRSESDIIARPTFDYSHQEILPAYLIFNDDYNLLISAKSELKKQYLYIKYIPMGNEYWPDLTDYFNYDVLSLIPGMALNDSPNIIKGTNCVYIEYDAKEDDIALYEILLTSYFGFEDLGSGILTNKYLNTLTIDISTTNSIIISAETK